MNHFSRQAAHHFGRGGFAYYVLIFANPQPVKLAAQALGLRWVR